MSDLILNIESTTTMCSVSLGEDGLCKDHLSVNDGYAHAEKLAPFIQELLNRNKVQPSALSAVAVSSGPGSYTGLRIGVALAKGLCFSCDLPLISVPTLQAMCMLDEVKEQVNFYKDLLLCPMLDARRMEVYTAMYDVGLKELVPANAMILDEQSFSKTLAKDGVLFFGPGSEKFKTLTSSKSAYFLDNVWPTSASMCALSQSKYEEERFEDVAYYEPFYLKEFQATTPKNLV